MGLSEERVAAFVFMLGILSAVAPPINVRAMLIAARANMPYVGFDLVLVPVLFVAVVSSSTSAGARCRNRKEAILARTPRRCRPR